MRHRSTEVVADVSRLSGLPLGWPADGLPFRSLTSALLAHLRAEILSARLKPGEKVLIAAVAKRLGVSLSAIREARSRLVAEGLVRAEDQRGFRVSPLSIVSSPNAIASSPTACS